MAFTVDDLPDLLRLIRSHPEWREALRREVLGPEVLQLPEKLDRIAALMERNSEAITRLEALVAQNSRDIARNTDAIAQNSRDIAKSTESIDRLEALVAQNSLDIAKNTEAIAKNTEAINRLVKRMDHVAGVLGDLVGFKSEWRWRMHFEGRFGAIIRRGRIITTRDLPLFLDADENGTITDRKRQASGRWT